MLILLISSHFKICPLQTVQKCAISRGVLHWAPNKQNHYFKKVWNDSKGFSKFG